MVNHEYAVIIMVWIVVIAMSPRTTNTAMRGDQCCY